LRAGKAIKNEGGETYNCNKNDCNNNGKDAFDKWIGGGPDPPPPTKLKCYVNGEASKDCGEGEHSCEVKYDGEEPNTASQICSKQMVPEGQTGMVKEGLYHCN
jgi:hypothetical protein